MEYLTRLKPIGLGLLRVDNLKPTQRLMDVLDG
jgi:hypothetical protein